MATDILQKHEENMKKVKTIIDGVEELRVSGKLTEEDRKDLVVDLQTLLEEYENLLSLMDKAGWSSGSSSVS